MRTLAWLGGAALGLIAPATAASSLQVSPVYLSFAAGETATSLTLHNAGANEIYGQVRAFHWSQQGGEDVLEPSDDIVASPPLVRVPAKSDQLVRLILRALDAAAKGERNYRIVIDELPSGDATPQSGVVIRLRYSVPLFVAAAALTPPELRWNLSKEAHGWSLRVANGGEKHAQISRVTLLAPDGKKQAITDGLLGYALGGQARSWPIALQGAPPPTGTWRVEATVNAQSVSSDLHVSTP